MVILRRAAYGLTQAALAERLDTTTLAIARIERGQHRVSEDTRRQLVDVLARR